MKVLSIQAFHSQQSASKISVVGQFEVNIECMVDPRLRSRAVNMKLIHYLLLSFGGHLRYICALRASAMRTPSSARLMGRGRVGDDL
jgi:hypothetical protein